MMEAIKVNALTFGKMWCLTCDKETDQEVLEKALNEETNEVIVKACCTTCKEINNHNIGI